MNRILVFKSLFWVSCLLFVLTAYLILFPPVISGTIDEIKEDEGYSYTYTLPQELTTNKLYSANGRQHNVLLTVFENGTPLLFPDQANSNIRQKGAGGYGYFGHQIYFSATDNTDPQINDKVYTYTVKMGHHSVLYAVFVFSFIVACLTSRAYAKFSSFFSKGASKKFVAFCFAGLIFLMSLPSEPLPFYLEPDSHSFIAAIDSYDLINPWSSMRPPGYPAFLFPFIDVSAYLSVYSNMEEKAYTFYEHFGGERQYVRSMLSAGLGPSFEAVTLAQVIFLLLAFGVYSISLTRFLPFGVGLCIVSLTPYLVPFPNPYYIMSEAPTQALLFLMFSALFSFIGSLTVSKIVPCMSKEQCGGFWENKASRALVFKTFFWLKCVGIWANKTRRVLVYKTLFWLSCLLFALTAYLIFFPPVISGTIDEIKGDEGYASVYTLSRELPNKLYSELYSANGNRHNVLLTLFENGTPLLLSDQSHSKIRQKGEGRYVHEGRHIYFSATDNTDPQVNSKVYTYTVKMAPRSLLYEVLVFSFLIACLASLSYARMSAFLSKRASKINRPLVFKTLFWLSCLVFALTAYLMFFANPPVISGTIDIDKIKGNGGYASLYHLPRELKENKLYSADGRRHDVLLTLFENGTPLLLSNQPHKGIRQKGVGRYSHSGDAIFFSATDNTDPQVNGKVYTYSIEMGVSSFLYGAFVFSFIAAFACLYLISHSPVPITICFFQQVPVFFQHSPWRYMLFACLMAACAILSRPLCLFAVPVCGLTILYGLWRQRETWKTSIKPALVSCFFLGIPLLYFAQVSYYAGTFIPGTHASGAYTTHIYYFATPEDVLAMPDELSQSLLRQHFIDMPLCEEALLAYDPGYAESKSSYSVAKRYNAYGWAYVMLCALPTFGKIPEASHMSSMKGSVMFKEMADVVLSNHRFEYAMTIFENTKGVFGLVADWNPSTLARNFNKITWIILLLSIPCALLFGLKHLRPYIVLMAGSYFVYTVLCSMVLILTRYIDFLAIFFVTALGISVYSCIATVFYYLRNKFCNDRYMHFRESEPKKV